MKYWRIKRLRQMPGPYLNSPKREVWLECGVARAQTEEQAARRAMEVVGGLSTHIMVDEVDEWYRPPGVL